MRPPTHIAAAIALALLLAGCGGSPQASPAPSESPSSTTSSSPSPSPSATGPTAPVEPAAIGQRNRKGAVAAVRWFVEATNFAAATGETGPFRETYTDFCTRCDTIAEGVEATYEQGGSIVGGAWVPTHFEYSGIRDDIAFIDILISTSSQTWIRREGAKPRKFTPTTDVPKSFQLAWVPESGWRVAALDPEQ